MLAHFWLEASDNIFFILVFIFQNKIMAKQQQKEGKKGKQGKLRSQNPEEAAGYDRINFK